MMQLMGSDGEGGATLVRGLLDALRYGGRVDLTLPTPDVVQGWLARGGLLPASDPDLTLLSLDDAGVAGSGLMGDVRRLRLGFDREAPGAPTGIIVKVPVPRQPESLAMACLEQAFYRSGRAARGGVRLPQLLHAGDAGILFLQDLGDGGWVPQSQGLTATQAQAALLHVAALHATQAFEGECPPPQPSASPVFAFCLRHLTQWDGQWPGGLGEVPHRITRNLDVLAELLTRGSTLVHGDFHSGNIQVSDDQVALIDFQFVQTASPMLDVARLLATSLTPDVRRTHEASLLASYASASDAPIDEVAFRAGLLWNFLVPLALHVAWMRMTDRAVNACRYWNVAT